MKYFFTYKTTNLVNGKFYYGKHETTNLNDGYLGSGIALANAIKKYGIENFKCEILNFYEDRESMVAAEKVLITEDVVLSKQTYNIALGGQGGNLGSIVNAKISQTTKGVAKGPFTEEHRKSIRDAKLGSTRSEEANKANRQTINELYSSLTIEQRKEMYGHLGEENGFYNKHHTKDLKDRFSKERKGKLLMKKHYAKPVTISNITYPSMKVAQDSLGVTRRNLIKLLGEAIC